MRAAAAMLLVAARLRREEEEEEVACPGASVWRPVADQGLSQVNLTQIGTKMPALIE